MPAPRLEYEVNRNLMLFAGAELRGGTYRVDDDFVGDPSEPGNLNNAMLTYAEIRTGAGLQWTIGEACKLIGRRRLRAAPRVRLPPRRRPLEDRERRALRRGVVPRFVLSSVPAAQPRKPRRAGLQPCFVEPARARRNLRPHRGSRRRSR